MKLKLPTIELDKEQLKHASLPMFVVLLWAVNGLVTRMSAGVVDPWSMAFYRWGLAFLVLTPFVAWSAWKQRALLRKHWYHLAILGLLGMALNQILSYSAAPHTTATMIGILGSLTPVFVALGNTFILREVPSWGLLVGTLITLGGLLYLVTAGHPFELFSQGIGIGEFLLLLANLGYTFYCVFLRLWNLPLTRWISLYGQIFFGSLFLLPTYLIFGSTELTWFAGALIVYSAIPNSIIAPFLWMVAISKLGTHSASLYMNYLPLIAAILAVIFLGESLSWYHIIGGGLTVFGVILTQRWHKKIF